MVIVSRNRLINDQHLQEGVWLKIWYGRHANQRLEERCKGSLAIKPYRIMITRKCLVKGYLEEGKLERFVVRLPYTKGTLLYLVLCPSNYIEHTYFVKSVWFRDTLAKQEFMEHVPHHYYNYDRSDRELAADPRTQTGLG
jgi:hypothetical protein